ncbi:MAG: hypothetical protein RIR11_3366 [Bacteroidota bacterium]
MSKHALCPKKQAKRLLYVFVHFCALLCTFVVGKVDATLWWKSILYV